jgi:hypothetical protein
MSTRHYDSGPTSNDLLERLVADSASAALRNHAVAQRAEDAPIFENTPAVSTKI